MNQPWIYMYSPFPSALPPPSPPNPSGSSWCTRLEHFYYQSLSDQICSLLIDTGHSQIYFSGFEFLIETRSHYTTAYLKSLLGSLLWYFCNYILFFSPIHSLLQQSFLSFIHLYGSGIWKLPPIFVFLCSIINSTVNFLSVILRKEKNVLF